MSLRGILLSSLVVVAPLSAGQAQGPAGSLMVGASKADITPTEKQLPPTMIIRDHLFARAIVVKDHGTCAVLVGLDQGGVPNEVMRDALPRVSQATGCPQQNVLISGTHTHSGSTIFGNGGYPDFKQVSDGVVKAVTEANGKLAPARVAFGTTQVYLNVNRDLLDHKWLQWQNPDGASDKTMAVVAFIGRDNNPIAFYMNYAMHPINFFLAGVISADFPGEASRYIERRYDQKTVAIFTQGSLGDQEPLHLANRALIRDVRTRAQRPITDTYNQLTPYELGNGVTNVVDDGEHQMSIPLKPEEMAAWKRGLEIDGEFVAAEGALVGESAIDVFREHMRTSYNSAKIWGGQTTFSCPGRDRVDKSVREGVLPEYKDGAPVNIKVSLVRIGNINLVGVDGEAYSNIGTHLKEQALDRETMLVSLTNGRANSGYIYSNDASDHLTFQVIGSRLRPYCAEDHIISSALDLMKSASAAENSQ